MRKSGKFINEGWVENNQYYYRKSRFYGMETKAVFSLEHFKT